MTPQAPPASLATLLLGKPDIAALARVRRPVVTMWIARHRDGPRPFPPPARSDNGREFYRGTEVVDWIVERGLGNNPAIREDLALHAALADLPDLVAPHTPPTEHGDPIVLLSALVALRAAIGEPLAGRPAADLLADARRIDPDDESLLAEVSAAGAELTPLAVRADLLCDAAYDPAAAFDTLVRRWRANPGAGSLPLADRAHELLGTLAAAILGDAADPLLIDPVPHDAGAVLAARAALGDASLPRIAVGSDHSGCRLGTQDRLARRHLLAHGLVPEPLDGAASAGASLMLMRLPDPAPGGPAAALTELVGHLRGWVPGGHALVIGPASVLTDPIPDPAMDAARWDLVRRDRVRCVVRLPEGLLPARPGTALALWVVGPARDLPADHRWMTVADLSAIDLARDIVTAVVTDAVASLAVYARASRHAFRFARIVPSSAIIARGAFLPVPPPTLTPGRALGSADVAVTVQLAADDLASAPVPAPPAVTVHGSTHPRARLVPAGRLAADRQLRMLSGARIDPAHVAATGAVPVIGPDEVAGRRRIGDRRIDRVLFSTAYPRARYTEPGDIVLCTAPRVRAIVDDEGSHAVLAPARILRITDPADSGLVPALVATELVRRAPDRKPAGSIRAGAGWRTWLLPVLDPEVVGDAAEALGRLDAYRRTLRDRLADADDLMQSLSAHLAGGAVTVHPSTAAAAGRAGADQER